jgi:hypothetical protein
MIDMCGYTRDESYRCELEQTEQEVSEERSKKSIMYMLSPPPIEARKTSGEYVHKKRSIEISGLQVMQKRSRGIRGWGMQSKQVRDRDIRVTRGMGRMSDFPSSHPSSRQASKQACMPVSWYPATNESSTPLPFSTPPASSSRGRIYIYILTTTKHKPTNSAGGMRPKKKVR